MGFEEEIVWIEMYNAAREAAIDKAGEDAGVQLSALERSAVGLFVGSMADIVSEHLPDADSNLSLLADLAGFVIGNPLWLKLLTGMSAELFVTDRELPDGLVGRAVDQAVEILRPYWECKLADVWAFSNRVLGRFCERLLGYNNGQSATQVPMCFVVDAPGPGTYRLRWSSYHGGEDTFEFMIP